MKATECSLVFEPAVCHIRTNALLTVLNQSLFFPEIFGSAPGL